jgi:uncharacterized RDD family membrane protein YckC
MPKNVPHPIVYASFTSRLWALVIDYVIIVSVYSVLLAFIPQKLLLSILQPVNVITAHNYTPLASYFDIGFLKLFRMYLVVQLLLMLSNYAYSVYLIARTGQTIGKKILGIKVLRRKDHHIPNCNQAFMRETVGKFISGLPLGFGFLTMITNSHHQTWHDKIAGTVVVKV